MSATMTVTVPFSDQFRAQQQTEADAVTWAATKIPTRDYAKRIQDYRAGHQQGWRDCISWLKFHGHLTVNENT